MMYLTLLTSSKWVQLVIGFELQDIESEVSCPISFSIGRMVFTRIAVSLCLCLAGCEGKLVVEGKRGALDSEKTQRYIEFSLSP